MEPALIRAITDKSYDKRKVAALELERIVRDASSANEVNRLNQLVGQLIELSSSAITTTRSGGIMGLAGISIALGYKIAEYLGAIVPPILACFNDTDSKVRYFACESCYNVAKVAKGEILIFFNELFDAMSKLAADTDPAVKNGAELLDRLIKDIVTEQASTYVSHAALSSPLNSPRASTSMSMLSTHEYDKLQQPERAFSLPRFIPLLRERIYVVNPFTRTYLVSWLIVLDSVPELELVSYLPDFLDGLLKFLADPIVDIRTTTQNVLADFLKGIREVAEVQQGRDEEWRGRREGDVSREEDDGAGRRSRRTSRGSDLVGAMDAAGVHDSASEDEREESGVDSEEEDYIDEGDEGEGSGAWIPGQGVPVDHGAIVEILLEHLTFSDEEIQSTCLRWIAEFLLFVQPTMVPFTPRLIPVILSSLAHHVPSIRIAANETNYNLYGVVQSLPILPSSPTHPPSSFPTPMTATTTRFTDGPKDRILTSSPPLSGIPFPSLPQPSTAPPTRVSSLDRPTTASNIHPPTPLLMSGLATQFESLSSGETEDRSKSSISEMQAVESDPFDYGATVNALTLQFLNEHEDTRVAALEWLLMLHQKAPKKILAIEDPSGELQSKSRTRAHPDSSESGLSIALLLKMLSDSSEKVLRYDLQLLAQISSAEEEASGMGVVPLVVSLLDLFSTDRRLLESRGSLIIRQLCLSLNTERIYRTFAEILERDEDLEFASIMVQNLNLIMITSPELADFRKRLKTLESKDGQTLFTILYRSWSHNAVATFSLCLLAGAYEQACSLLQIFAELEITVSLLIQIDKLVQLLESPVFTSLRLQLLEPDRYPFLLKAMYGLLMLLPQSSAFATLRNRLSAVSSLGFLQSVPKTYAATTTRSTVIRRDDVRWNELLTHFRSVQKRRSSAAVHLGNEVLESVTPSSLPSHPNGNGTTLRGGRGGRRKPATGVGRDQNGGTKGGMGGWKLGMASAGSSGQTVAPGRTGGSPTRLATAKGKGPPVAVKRL